MRTSNTAHVSALALLSLLISSGVVQPVVSSANAAEPVSAAAYGLSIGHRTIGTLPLDNGITGLELELTLRNDGEKDLYDLRVFLERTGSGPAITHEPARVASLASGEVTTLTWTFEGVVAPLAAGPDSGVSLRVEAVDTTSQEIVTFTVHSSEN